MNGLPGYAGAVVNPALTAAIESTRQALQDLKRIPDTWPQAFGGDQLRIDDPSRLLRWQPDVRSTVVEFEAVAGISFETDDKSSRLVVYPSDPKASGNDVTSKRSILVTMSRPSVPVLIQQAGLVAEAAGDRVMPKSGDVATRDRLTEITAQVVPPFAFWCAVLPIQPDRMPRTIELIQLTLALCSFAEQRFKHALAVPRPQYFDPKVVPAILTPSHGSLPSGHSTEAFAVSNMLYQLLACDAQSNAPEDAALRRMLLALAARIANNRMVAGLHTPIDTSAGRMLGTVLADYLLARCTGRTSVLSGHFPGAELKAKGSKLFLEDTEIIRNLPNVMGDELVGGNDLICTVEPAAAEIFKSEALGWLWDKAREEWGHAASGT